MNSEAPAPRSGPVLRAEFQVRVGRGRGEFALEATLELDDGVLVLFGPSGTGKSLTVAVLAGLLRPKRGAVRVLGSPVFDSEAGLFVPAHRRRIGYVPQHRSLFPFKNVADNVAFGLPRAERRRDSPRVRQLLDSLSLGHLADARPDTLSGGEQQRVALARALAPQPHLLLLDEPFASLDRSARRALRRDLKDWLRRWDTPAVFVTHDAEEALELGDRVVLFERGRTVAAGTAVEMLGSDAELAGRVTAREELEGQRVRLRLEGASIEGRAEGLPQEPGETVRAPLRRQD